MRRRTLAAIPAIAALMASSALAAAPVGAGVPLACEVMVSINDTPYVEDDASAYSNAKIEVTGTDWPALTRIDLEATPSGTIELSFTTTESGRLLARIFTQRSDPAQTYEVTVFDPENPACSDSFTFHHLGPLPYFDDTARYPEPLAMVWMYEAGITDGCYTYPHEPELGGFCPYLQVLRDQVAAFLVRALDLPATTVDAFTDDELTRLEWHINALAAAGIAEGCGEGLFCPRHPLSRAEMASFMVRAFELPPSATDAFTDDTGNTHEADINALAAAGLTQGCSAGAYCPNGLITRYEVALLFYRLLGAT